MAGESPKSRTCSDTACSASAGRTSMRSRTLASSAPPATSTTWRNRRAGSDKTSPASPSASTSARPLPRGADRTAAKAADRSVESPARISGVTEADSTPTRAASGSSSTRVAAALVAASCTLSGVAFDVSRTTSTSIRRGETVVKRPTSRGRLSCRTVTASGGIARPASRCGSVTR
jgi:hypothetical protein